MTAVGGADDDLAAVRAVIPVSRETGERLTTLVALLRKWQRAENLVGAGTLADIWGRHVADSAQLIRILPDARRWLDLGSGAGFPGLVLAVFMKELGGQVDLVESNQRKCAFLRQAIRATGAPATVHHARIESAISKWRAPVDVVTARALAPLSRLFDFVSPLFGWGAVAAFHKGRDFAREIFEASKSWDFDLIEHKSLIESDGVILVITRLARKAGGADQRERVPK